MKVARILFFALASSSLLVATRAQADFKFKHRWEISAAAQNRELNQTGLSEMDSQMDTFFLFALEQNVNFGNWAFEARPELRALMSPSLKTPANDLSRISIIDRSRALDLHQQLSPSEDNMDSNSLVVSDIEKLNLRYQGSNFEMILGRNPFNPSIMRLAPIWNKFGKDVFYLGYPNLQFNPDMTSLKFTNGNFWIQNANVFGNEDYRHVYLMIAGLNLESIEMQALAGKMWLEPVYGFNINISTEESLIKAEVLHITGDDNISNNHTQAALGYETSWTESLSTVTEYIYSTLPDQFEDRRNITLGASAFFKLRSKSYLANQFDYQFSEIWTGSLTPIFNLDDTSYILAAALRGSLTDNLEINFNARYGFGKDGNEFSEKSVYFITGGILGYNNTASVMLRYFFN